MRMKEGSVARISRNGRQTMMMMTMEAKKTTNEKKANTNSG